MTSLDFMVNERKTQFLKTGDILRDFPFVTTSHSVPTNHAQGKKFNDSGTGAIPKTEFIITIDQKLSLLQNFKLP